MWNTKCKSHKSAPDTSCQAIDHGYHILDFRATLSGHTNNVCCVETCFKNTFLCGSINIDFNMSHCEGRHEQHIHHSGSCGRFFANWKEMPILSMLRLYRLLHRPRLNYMSTHLISPHKVFNNPLPSPPQWSRQIPVLSDSNLAAMEKLFDYFGTRLKSFRILFLPAQWKECNGDKQRLGRTLNRFTSTLCSIHRRKINWLKDESFPNEWAYSTTWPSSSHQFSASS